MTVVKTVEEVERDIVELAARLAEHGEMYSLSVLLKALREQAQFIEAVLKE